MIDYRYGRFTYGGTDTIWGGFRAVPASDPILSRIRQAAVYSLENRVIGAGQAIEYKDIGNTVISDYGYYRSIKHAFDPAKDWENILEFPSVNVIIENDRNSLDSYEVKTQDKGFNQLTATLRLEVFLEDVNNPALAQDYALADIRKFFGINYWIPDESGAQTAFNIIYSDSDRSGLEVMNPRSWLIINFTIWYSDRIDDPTKSGYF